MKNRSEIIHANPIGKGLDGFRDKHSLDLTEVSIVADNERTVSLVGFFESQLTRVGKKKAIFDLLLALQTLPASQLLPPKRSNGIFHYDLIRLLSAVRSNCYDLERIKPLLDVVLNGESDETIWDTVYESMPPFRTLSLPPTPWSQNTSNLSNSTEQCKYVGISYETQSTSTSASLFCRSFLRLPPEIRCLIYRDLLLSERHIRMTPPPQDGYHIPCPNNLYPSILGTCRLIYQEAHYVLYGENSFRAHRINKENPNAALIRRAKYCIGLYEREDGEDDAKKLADFLGFQKELRFLELDIRFDLIEDPDIYQLAYNAVRGHRHLMDIEILSPFIFSEIGWRHSWRLREKVMDQARLLEWLEK